MGVTREAIMKNIPEITSEQLDAMLALYGTELQAEQKKTEEWKAKAGQIATLEAQLAEKAAAEQAARAEIEKLKSDHENKNLSEVELLRKQLKQQDDDHKKELGEMRERWEKSEINAYAASNGLAGDEFSVISKAFVGDIDLAKAAIDGIVALKGKWEEAAKLAKEQEIAKQSGNPGSNAGAKIDATDDTAMQLAKTLTTKTVGVNQDILNQYIRN